MLQGTVSIHRKVVHRMCCVNAAASLGKIPIARVAPSLLHLLQIVCN